MVLSIFVLFLTVGRCVGAEAWWGAGEDRSPGAGVRCSQGGPGHSAQKTDGGPGVQNETNHHQRWTVQKGNFLLTIHVFYTGKFWPDTGMFADIFNSN